MQHEIVVHTHHDGEDANQFSVNVEAPTLAAAMASVKQTSAQATVAGWQHFDESEVIAIPGWRRVVNCDRGAAQRSGGILHLYPIRVAN